MGSDLDESIAANDLEPPQEIVAQNFPEQTLLSIAPGGLRVWAVNALWIRCQQAKEAGRYYDAFQLAELICMLQPRSAGVWQFHAWNMAWNISAALHTPEQRWLWISNAYRLLRDRAIPINPESLELYKELSWLLSNKIGANMDEMHWHYKVKWAAQMHGILGSPPAGSTKEVIAAFKVIADAPLEKDPARDKGPGKIQTDVLKRDILDVDAMAARYAAKLAELSIGIDKSLLDAYLKYSTDELVMYCVDPFNRVTDNDYKKKIQDLRNATGIEKDQKIEQIEELEKKIEIAKLIKDPTYSKARNKLIAFVRAQILWNEYRMDPDYMLQLMKDYDVPFDWRQPWPHGFYWMSEGFRRSKRVNHTKVNSLNSMRNLLGPMKDLTSNGRMVYIENTRDPDSPFIRFHADARYIEATHQLHVKLIDKYIDEMHEKYPAKKVELKDNPLGSGHANYLRTASMMLLRSFRTEEATKYWQYIKDTYQYTGEEWEFDTPQDAWKWHYSQKGNRLPRPGVVKNQVTAGLQSAWYLLANGNLKGFERHKTEYAKMTYDAYMEDVPERNKLGPFVVYMLDTLENMLVEPRSCGYHLLMYQRMQLWNYALTQRFDEIDVNGPRFTIAAVLYDKIIQSLTRQCENLDKNVDDIFPPPGDIDEYRQLKREMEEKSNLQNQQ